MFAPSTDPAPALPVLELKEIRQGINVIPALSRAGHGPGLITLVPDSTSQLLISDGAPWPSLKWAEEGYVVAEIQACALQSEPSEAALSSALQGLEGCDRWDSQHDIGMVVYSPTLWKLVEPVLTLFPKIVAVVNYGDASNTVDSPNVSLPILQHLAGKNGETPEQKRESAKSYHYPAVKSHQFALPLHEHFNYAAESVSHSRSLSFLKPLLKGPYFDLETIWEEHTHYEFTDRSPEHTMSTMVQEPYVNHIPTLTGGIGRSNLTKFYREHFIFQNSTDTENELISRTIGIDRIVDEFIFKFTHDREIDWLLPGVPPTYKKAEVPMTAVVNIRGDRLYHEHIAWDQAGLLRQLGLLPEYLPFPYKVGSDESEADRVEYRVPVLGLESASKMREKNSVPSNEMFSYSTRKA